MEHRYSNSPQQVARMSTAELRAAFLVEDLFVPGEIRLVHSEQDRVILAGACPAGNDLILPAPPELRAETFLERREVGILCVTGEAQVSVGDQDYAMPAGALLYAGRGAGEIRFAGNARLYLFSAPAHTAYPTTLALPGSGNQRRLGEQVNANQRIINQYIHADGIRSCQIVMGVTQLEPGSTWNTMPAHTHARRMEAYLYFDLPDDARVVHLMGEPTETRHLMVGNEQAVISPSWSIHAGVGTQAYSFCWAMAGENQAFDDMDPAPITELR